MSNLITYFTDLRSYTSDFRHRAKEEVPNQKSQKVPHAGLFFPSDWMNRTVTPFLAAIAFIDGLTRYSSISIALAN
jgi:hypothetical protein